MRFKGEDVLTFSRARMRQARRDMQIVFQDPYSSLNPRMRVGAIVEEPLIIHQMGSKAERRARVAELFELVGLDAAQLTRYPHQFSGGQRQRIGLARALALNPSLIIADEPVSALDVSVQAQVVNLLMDLQERLKLTYLFIAHDLRLVRHICSRVAVMYLGKIVEMGPTERSSPRPRTPTRGRCCRRFRCRTRRRAASGSCSTRRRSTATRRCDRSAQGTSRRLTSGMKPWPAAMDMRLDGILSHARREEARMLRDLRLAFRSLRSWRFGAVVAVLTLAVGIGTATSMYALVRTALSSTIPDIDDLPSLGRIYASSRTSGSSARH